MPNREIKSSALRRKKIRSLGAQPYRKVYKFLLVGLLLYLSFCFGRLHYENIVAEIELSRQQTMNSELLGKKQQREEEKAKLYDLEYLKEYGRENLYLIGPEEVQIKITPNPDTGSEERPGSEPRSEKGLRR